MSWKYEWLHIDKIGDCQRESKNDDFERGPNQCVRSITK